MNFEPLSEPEVQIAKKIVDAAYTLDKALGPGLLERGYEVCFCQELAKRRLFYRRQVDVLVVYDGITFSALDLNHALF